MIVPAISGYAVMPMTLLDAEDWAAYAVLPASNQFVSTATTSSADIVPMIQRTMSGDPNAPLLFAIRDHASSRLVATVGFHTVSSFNRAAEITYTVDPEFWGKGVATRACRSAVQWAFEHKQWVRVQATTLEEHKASQRVLLKCGFQLEGTVRNFRLVRGVPRDYLLFSAVPANAPPAA